ncbi:MAG: glycosyltransferase family 2 protein, partial [Pseudomonadota bacterium]
AMVIVGVQMVWFFLLARLFAVRFSLLPSSQRFERFRARLTVDRACLIGGALLACATLLLVGAFGFWGSLGFGDLEQGTIVRLVTLVTLAAALGIQAITSGFLWGLLEQKLETPESTPAQTHGLKP